MKLAHSFPESFFKPTAEAFVVGTKTKLFRAVLLDMLLSLDEVCRKHGIAYFLDSGTLLGAVRHKGFVPWDNDLDVILTRGEYDKLCRVADDEFKSPLFFQTEYADRGSARGHAQLRRSDTTAILRMEMTGDRPVYAFNQGVFLDIFVLDAVPDDPGELAAFRSLLAADRKKVGRARRCLYGRQSAKIDFLHPGSVAMRFLSKWYRFKKRVFGVDELLKAYRRFEADAARYNGRGMRRVANFSLDPQCGDSQIFDRSVYGKSATYEFEGHGFPGPADFETVLRGYYGDWHAHEVGGSLHGDMLIDLDRPYTEYLGE